MVNLTKEIEDHLLFLKRKGFRKVIIEVYGGVAYIAEAPSDVEVEIIDYDNLDADLEKSE